ncbi:MAG TPA: RNA-binding cell elongation regulator Jag/EloR [Anaerovoracaceae bacterium]|nr:RNA-binding cell elongation regulator Jag/EloR [Anaerovoracaceae bacterium]
MDFSEKWGTSVENAVELALIDLKLTKEQVDIIIIEEPSKGFFGIGSKLAKVRVEKKAYKPEKFKAPEIKEEVKPVRQQPRPAREEARPSREEVRPAKEEARTIREESRTKPFFERAKEPAREKAAYEVRNKPVFEVHKKEANFEGLRQEKPENLVPVAEDNKVLAFLNEITQKMGLEVTLEAKENEDIIYVDIEGKDSGTIIGKRGQTLDAIQYLTSLVANKGDGKYIKVVVDAENYRQKREKTLEQLANRLASKVTKSRKSVRLEPMNPYERKVIHATLQSNPEVTTRSEGEEPYRRVIIDLK